MGAERRGLRAWLADLLLGRGGSPPGPKPKPPRAARKITRLADDLDRLRDQYGDPHEGPRDDS
jgi:pimeloyl-ACP methyl ester carboxylesterase